MKLSKIKEDLILLIQGVCHIRGAADAQQFRHHFSSPPPNPTSRQFGPPQNLEAFPMVSTLNQSRRSHADTIALALNRYLKPQGTLAKVAQRDQQIQILLEAIDIPSRDQRLPWIKQTLETLKLDSIKTVQIYARRAGDKNCIWTAAFVWRSGKLMPMDAMTMAQTQPDVGDLLTRSRSGDVTAIALFLDRALDNPSLRTHVELHRAVLKVTIETFQYLDGSNFAVELARKLKPIASPKVQFVEVYKRKSATTSPVFLNRIELMEPAQPSNRLATPT
jgi:hypothetical protein